MRAIINFCRQVFALSFYKLAIESMQNKEGSVVIRVRVRFSGFTYESTPKKLKDEIIKFPPLHAFVIGYLFILTKRPVSLNTQKLELVNTLLNQEEFLMKFEALLNLKVLHDSKKLEVKVGALKNEINILDLKTHPELISSVSSKNAYQLGVTYGDLCE